MLAWLVAQFDVTTGDNSKLLGPVALVNVEELGLGLDPMSVITMPASFETIHAFHLMARHRVHAVAVVCSRLPSSWFVITCHCTCRWTLTVVYCPTSPPLTFVYGCSVCRCLNMAIISSSSCACRASAPSRSSLARC